MPTTIWQGCKETKHYNEKESAVANFVKSYMTGNESAYCRKDKIGVLAHKGLILEVNIIKKGKGKII